jgi:hypothetical protein
MPLEAEMSLTTEPLTRALESSDASALGAALADDVAFRTPILAQALQGKVLALRYLEEAAKVITGLSYYDTVGDADLNIMFWRGQIIERDIEGATIIKTDGDGLVSDLTVVMRSWSVVQLFRDAMLIALSDVLPVDAWELGTGNAPEPDADAEAGRSTSLALATGAKFHSPMLTKTIAGADNVQKIHKLIGGIQGTRTYHARFESEGRRVEYWTCVIDGHPQQGIDDLAIDANGQLTDQRVWLRPWPVTTILRDRAMAGGLPFLGPDVWLLPAHPSPLA